MNYAVAIIVGYLLGCVNPAYFLGKMKGFDIRERGSGNAGASNAKVTIGWWAFFVVAIYDICKAAACMLIMKYLYPGEVEVAILAGCVAVFGHCFPFYLDWKGGKGFAGYIGVMLIIDFKLGVMMLAFAVVMALLTNYIVTATFIYIFGIPVMVYYLGLSPVAIAITLVTSCMMLYKHKINIVRFFKKEEIGINGKLIGINMNKK